MDRVLCHLSYGLSANCYVMFALSCQEHTAIETKPDHSLDDLRLNSPWPELKRYSASIFSLVMCSCHSLNLCFKLLLISTNLQPVERKSYLFNDLQLCGVH